MGVDVLVVVTQGQLAVLAVKAVVAGIVLPRGADAVPAPVPEGVDDLVEQRVVRVHRAALAHGHMVGRVEAGGADVAHRAGELCHLFAVHVQGVAASQGVAVVLHQPQVVFVAKCLHRSQIVGIAQGVSDHHGLGFLGAGRLQHGHVDVVLGNGHVHEHRYRAVLDHGVDRGGEATGHGDDLVPPLHPALSQKGGGQGHKGDQVG